ncbi:MAG: hypothetical protein ACOC33_00490 [bacterium]
MKRKSIFELNPVFLKIYLDDEIKNVVIMKRKSIFELNPQPKLSFKKGDKVYDNVYKDVWGLGLIVKNENKILVEFPRHPNKIEKYNQYNAHKKLIKI